jgi:hypothetical protein
VDRRGTRRVTLWCCFWTVSVCRRRGQPGLRLTTSNTNHRPLRPYLTPHLGYIPTPPVPSHRARRFRPAHQSQPARQTGDHVQPSSVHRLDVSVGTVVLCWSCERDDYTAQMEFKGYTALGLGHGTFASPYNYISAACMALSPAFTLVVTRKGKAWVR